MDAQSGLIERFEAERPRLRGIAYRMLGSLSEAEDAVQETWLRLTRVDATGIGNFGGWLTTVVARVCLDALRARQSRREEPLGAPGIEPDAAQAAGADPEGEAVLADSVGVALLVVLETLTPAERLAFVLHDLFGVPFEEIARITDRSTDAVKQLASRARRRVRGAPAPAATGRARQRQVVEAFLRAARAGDFAGLLAVLDPEVDVRIDAAARIDAPPAEAGQPREVRGAALLARHVIAFPQRLHAVQPALIDGSVGLIVAPRGRLLRAMRFTVTNGAITRLEVIGDAARLRTLAIAVL